jgi:hypothetical protein
MHSVSVIGASLLSILALSSASPLKRAYNPFPLSDGFPNPSPQQLAKTQETAAGTLPNGPPPPKLSDQGVLNLQVIAVNELFEVAYFNELLSNVTNNVEGYHIEDKSAREVMINTLTNVRAVGLCLPLLTCELFMDVTLTLTSIARGIACPQREYRTEAFWP